MPIFVVYAIQIALVIHVLKTGRDRYWIWLLLFVPLVGGAAYLIIEVLPGFSSSLQGQRAMRGVRQALNPGADLKKNADAWEQSPNVDNARFYVDSLLHHGSFSQAMEVLDQAQTGLFATEPNLMLLRARCLFESGEAAQAVTVLEALTEHNPEFRSAEGHLLHARALQDSDRMEQALAAYRDVSEYYPGAEARYRYARALQLAGRQHQARQAFEQLLNDARLAPAHFRNSQKAWLTKARSRFNELD